MAARRVGNFVQTNILRAGNAAREQESRVLQDIARDTIGSTFFEEDPSVTEWFRDLAPTASGVADYFHNLFPSASWIRRYNLHWLLGDAIAGKEDDTLLSVIKVDQKFCRCHCRPRCGSSSYGVRDARSAKPGLRLVHDLHRRLSVLDIRDLQGYCHWREFALERFLLWLSY
jgi:hypothetical protein